MIAEVCRGSRRRQRAGSQQASSKNATETNPRQEPGKEWGQFISLDTLFDFGMAEKMDERPSSGRLAAPGNVSCRALFLAFLIHQRSAPCCAEGGPSWCSWPGASRVLPRSRR